MSLMNGSNSPVKIPRITDDYGNPVQGSGMSNTRGKEQMLLEDSPMKTPEYPYSAQSNSESDHSPMGKRQSGVLPLQGFGNYEDHAKDNVIFESPCLLKTKTDRYKVHWCLLTGNELYCYRTREDIENGEPHRVMHSLIGTFAKEMPAEMS